MTEITFLGTGAMGSRMVARLLDAGHAVTVWNRTAEAAEPLKAKGAIVAASPKAAATGAEIVISMLTDDTAARAVWLDPETGAANGLAPGAIAVEAGTVTPAWTADLARAAAGRGAKCLDAPVAGSRPQAEAGQLIFMVGGAAADVEAAAPVLRAMGSAVHHVGGTGQGAVLKLAVNTLFAAQLAAAAELLGYLAKAGIEPTDAAETLAVFPVVGPAVAGAMKLMAAGDDRPMFTIDLIVKDLGYALADAERRGARLAVAPAVRAAFATARGGDNVSGLARVYLEG